MTTKAVSVNERPILFSAPMVRALRAGVKSQTRRVVKGPYEFIGGAGDDRNDPTQWGYECDNGNWCYLKLPRDARHHEAGGFERPCPYGQVGDRLWVKTTHFRKPPSDLCPEVVWDPTTEITRSRDYRGDYEDQRESFESFVSRFPECKPRPSIFMPRWASRILLEVTSLRVERVESISEDDAVAEGFVDEVDSAGACFERTTAREKFLATFYDINERAPRGSNPWVWVVGFKVLSKG